LRTQREGALRVRVATHGVNESEGAAKSYRKIRFNEICGGLCRGPASYFESEGREFESLRARQICISGAEVASLPIRIEASALKIFDSSVKHCTRFAAP
jgi:hypothetical protein